MRAADLFTAALLGLIGAIVIWDALRLGIGWGTDGPKSGFFPFWLAVLMGLTLVAIFVQSALRSSARPFVTRAQLRPVLSVLAPAVGFIVLMQVVGLYVAGALYLGLSMRWLGRHAWSAVAAVSLGLPIAIFVIFERWFVVPLPKGPLEAWLGY